MYKGVVYCLKCEICEATYIGQSGCHSKTRINQHFHKNGTMTKHHETTHPNQTMSINTKILEKERHNKKRLILEAMYIKERKPILNDKEELERTLKLFEAYQQLSQE